MANIGVSSPRCTYGSWSSFGQFDRGDTPSSVPRAVFVVGKTPCRPSQGRLSLPRCRDDPYSQVCVTTSFRPRHAPGRAVSGAYIRGRFAAVGGRAGHPRRLAHYASIPGVSRVASVASHSRPPPEVGRPLRNLTNVLLHKYLLNKLLLNYFNLSFSSFLQVEPPRPVDEVRVTKVPQHRLGPLRTVTSGSRVTKFVPTALCLDGSCDVPVYSTPTVGCDPPEPDFGPGVGRGGAVRITINYLI